jgi:hypothetical protein
MMRGLSTSGGARARAGGSALQRDASATATTDVLSAIAAGAYYLLVVADGGQTVRESIELNNTAARLLQIAPGNLPLRR